VVVGRVTEGRYRRMLNHATDTKGRRSRPFLLYATLPPLVILALLLVLPAGNDIAAAPQGPALGTVNAEAATCLGSRIATVQSGVFVDLYEPGQAGGLPGDELGAKLADGRIDRESGEGDLDGTCAGGTDRAGQAFTLAAAIAGEDGDDPDSVIRGELLVGGDRLEVRIEAEDEGSAPAATTEPLEGSELVGRIFLAVAVVIAASRAIGFLFARIRQPRVIGEIVAGILLGPSLLGLWFPEVTEFLFPVEVSSVLRVLAQFGLIFFMFLIGLELDRNLMKGSGHLAVLISHVSIVAPFVLGLTSALVLYPLLGSGDFTGFALFMGAAMAITAFPVLARILTDTGLHRTRIGSLAITCAAVDDVTAWCILAVVVATVNAAGAADWITTIALSGVFVAAMLLVVRPLASRVATVHQARGRLNPPLMSAIIIALFLSAWITEEIGIHAIFGAFMLGAVMPRSHKLAAEITERLEDVTVLVFLPVFFAVVGLSTRIGLLSGAELWLVAGFVVVIAISGKLGGSMLAARAAGETWRSSTALGLLMNARGITEIVILSIGRSLGVISPTLFTIMVLMALVTTFMTTPLLSVVYPKRLVGLDQARAAAVDRVSRGTGRQLRVLVGVDQPDHARPLVDLVQELRAADGNAPSVVLATVVRPPGREEVRANLAALDDAARDASQNLAGLRERLERTGVSCEIATTVGTEVAPNLARLANEHQADLILVRAHQAYLGRNPLGGIPGDLFREAACDVAVLVGTSLAGGLSGGPVAVWFKGLLRDLAAVDLATSLARGRGTTLRIITPVSFTVPSFGVPTERVVLQEPTTEHALASVEGASVVVVGQADVSDGALPRLRRAVIVDSPVPVLVVKSGPGAAPESTVAAASPASVPATATTKTTAR
jgi:Kef-type K+ transport system membrane component KefB/nucleotide-binding universal stress UspA family protein